MTRVTRLLEIQFFERLACSRLIDVVFFFVEAAGKKFEGRDGFLGFVCIERVMDDSEC